LKRRAEVRRRRLINLWFARFWLKAKS